MKAAALALVAALLFGVAAVTGGWPPATPPDAVDGVHMHQRHRGDAAPARGAVAVNAIAYAVQSVAGLAVTPRSGGPVRNHAVVTGGLIGHRAAVTGGKSRHPHRRAAHAPARWHAADRRVAPGHGHHRGRRGPGG